jgi:uroporphyrinogen decarboxylase
MPGMTPRQRVLAALRREEPDRVPRELSWGAFTPALMDTFRERTGSQDPAEYWNFEVREVAFRYPDPSPWHLEHVGLLPAGASVDAFGVASAPGTSFHFVRYVHPLAAATLNEFLDYPLPDVRAPEYWGHLEPQIRALHSRGLAAVDDGWLTVFETTFALRGLEQLLTDFLAHPDFADALLERLTVLRCYQAGVYARAGLDVLRLGDDVATQRSMMMRPALWRRFLKPRLARIIEAARAGKPDILIFYHSDGDCRAIVPELIEVGVDILNPVQPECMDPAEMKRLYGDRLAFWGTVGTQTTFPFGTPEEVRAVVRERIRTVGRGGGLLLAPTHILEPEVPWENVEAFFQAIDE